MSEIALQAAEAFRQGVTCHQQLQLEEARRFYEQALKMQPDHVQALTFMAVIALQTGHPDRAIGYCGEAIRIDPHCVAAHLSLGHARSQLGQFDDALASLDRVITLDPTLADAHLHRGDALMSLQRPELAVTSYEQAIALKPDVAAAFSRRALALADLKQHDAALGSIDTAIRIDPLLVGAHFIRGNILKDLGRFAAALASYDQGIAMGSVDAQAHCNRGYLLGQLDRQMEALDSYDRAIAIDPDCVDAHLNRGSALTDLGQAPEAIASYTRAIALRPDCAQAHFGRAFASLLAGDLTQGWRDYEWRWKNEGSPTFGERRNFPQPRWHGDEPIAGKTLFLHREQGLGDALQFCRYVKLLADRGARVVLEIHAPLVGLFAGLAGVSRLIERGDALPDFDYWCPLLSLPLAFQTRLETIPAAVPYLRSDPDRVARWRRRLGDKSVPHVGLVWSGAEVHPNDHNRSLPLSVLLAHLPAGIRYVSLQNHVRARDRGALQAAAQVLDFADDLHDFADTAALCDCMDAVITVDSSVAHLSGAMAKPTWILLPASPDWRWLLGRTDSPWYPSARLYRQETAGDWSRPLMRISADLQREFC